jgi:hypothetical protein
MNNLINMRRAGSIITIALILFTFANVSSFSSEADLITQIEVITSQNCEVDVSPGSLANGTVKGIVSCTNIDTSTPVVVDLTVDNPIGNTSLNKAQIIFQGSHNEEEIEIYVQLPTLTSAYEIHKFTVSGYWEQGTTNGTVIPGEFLVIPLPFYRFTLACNDSSLEVTQGESACFNFNINNTGNFVDDYQVNVTNIEDLESFNMEIPLIPRFTIEVGDKRTLMLIVHTSSDTPVGDYPIHVNVTSVGSESEGEGLIFQEYTLTVSVNEESKENDGWGEENLIVPLILLIVVILIIIMVVILRKRMRTRGGS